MNINETLKDREQTHGNFHEGALVFCSIVNYIEKAKNLDSSHRYAATMIATKLARILNGDPNNADHWRDIAGYAMLGGRLDAPEESLSPQPVVDTLPRVESGDDKCSQK
mgnify:CR=1 FL=1